MVLREKSSTFAPAIKEIPTLVSNECLHRGVEQLVARQAHNLEVACSSPASATKESKSHGLAFSFLIAKIILFQIGNHSPK